MVDWNFIIESLEYARTSYEEKAQKYCDIPNYKELTYAPKLKQFAKAIHDLIQLRAILELKEEVQP